SRRVSGTARSLMRVFPAASCTSSEQDWCPYVPTNKPVSQSHILSSVHSLIYSALFTVSYTQLCSQSHILSSVHSLIYSQSHILSSVHSLIYSALFTVSYTQLCSQSHILSSVHSLIYSQTHILS